MQVNMERPRAIAKLLSGLAQQKFQEESQLIGIAQERVKKQQLQNLASTYLQEFNSANGDIAKIINANTGLASGLFASGDFDGGTKVVTSNNTLASKLFASRNPKPAAPVTLLDKDGNPITVYPQGPDAPAKIAPGIVTKTGEPAPSGLMTPQAFGQKKADERQLKGIDATTKNTQTQINAAEERQRKALEQQRKEEAQKAERADINLINTHLASIKEFKNKKADWEKRLATAETEEEKVAIQKNIDDIDVQLIERDNIIKNTQRKYPHWMQPGQSSNTSGKSSGKKGTGL